MPRGGHAEHTIPLSLPCHSDHLQNEEKGMGILGGCSHPGVCCPLLNLQQEDIRECLAALVGVWLLWLAFSSRKNHRFHHKAIETSEKVHLHLLDFG